MVWIRLVLFSAPLWVIGGAAWLIGQARDFEFSSAGNDRSALVVVVREAPGFFNPLAPSTGSNREITELVFDRPFRRDDELILRPHLVKSWEFRRRATFFFTGDESSKKAAEKIEQSKELWKEWGLLDAVREGNEIHVVLSEHRPDVPEKVAGIFDPDWLAQMLHIRLTLKEAVKPSLENFLAGSIEKEQIQHTRFQGDRVADLFLLGETDLFLKELRLYYESNLNLEPSIEVLPQEFVISGLELILTLRDDVKWHDGEPLTADDLLFTYEELARPGSAHPFKQFFGHVEKVEKVGSHTLRVRAKEYYAPMLESWERLPILPQHVLRDVRSAEEWKAFFRNPIGSGPYAVEARNDDGSVVLRANADYPLGKPRQEKILYRVMTEPEERLLGVRLGRIDVFVPDDREKGWIAQDPEVGLVLDVPRYQNFIAWNLDRPLLADSRVRQALAKSIDIDALIKECGQGRIQRCRGLFFPGSRWGSGAPETHSYDREATRNLLTAAGWKREDGRWRDPKGEPVILKLSFDRANPLHVELAERLSNAWGSEGIGVEIEETDWAEIIEKRLGPRDFDALLLSWELGYGRDQFDIWHSSGVSIGGSNLAGLRNQVVDETLEKIRIVDDEEAVMKLVTTLQEQIHELQPFLFLCETGSVMAVKTARVRVARPRLDGSWSIDPVSVGRSGIHSSRPWWVKDSNLEGP